MKVADGVEMLELSSNVMGMANVINPTLLRDSSTTILVDTGYPGQLPQIREAVEKAGIPFDKLDMIILTHHDIDHVGSLPSITIQCPNNLKVLSHVEEKPYIQGELTPVKLAQLEAKLDSSPMEAKIMYEKLKSGFQSSRTKIDDTLTDEQELPYCGGITVIHTPGHTPGHICLYLKQNKILIAGDILCIEKGLLIPCPQHINHDNTLNLQSLKKLLKYDIDTVICYHGGKYNDNVNTRIMELIKR